ncbi:MAG: molybdate ABC transporter substrate-binding protein, partial [Rhodospirillaceae bacterium]
MRRADSFRFAIVAFVVAAATAAVPALAQDGGVVVFAAASMKNALDDAAKTWQAQGKATRIS